MTGAVRARAGEPARLERERERWAKLLDNTVGELLPAKELTVLLDAVLAELARRQARGVGERERLLFAVRRDHMADNDCTVAPCAWCEDLIAILPDAQVPPPELGARGACTNKGCALEDRAGKSYRCNGDAQWCTACLRWHYEPLQQRAERAEGRVAELETALGKLEWQAEQTVASCKALRSDNDRLRTNNGALNQRAEQAEGRERALREMLRKEHEANLWTSPSKHKALHDAASREGDGYCEVCALLAPAAGGAAGGEGKT